MLALLNPTVWLVALALMLSSYAGGRWQQYQSDRKDQVAAVLKETVKARETEQNLHDDYGVLNDLKDQEIRRIAAARDAAVAGLRNRPERLPDTAKAACNGATGAELSRPDGEFLTRLAADADELRSEYAACQAREWKTYEALKGKP
jgi:hypothetical protein